MGRCRDRTALTVPERAPSMPGAPPSGGADDVLRAILVGLDGSPGSVREDRRSTSASTTPPPPPAHPSHAPAPAPATPRAPATAPDAPRAPAPSYLPARSSLATRRD